MPRLLYHGERSPECPEYPLNKKLNGLKSQSGRFGEEKNLLPLLGIEPQILSCPVIVNELFWLHIAVSSVFLF
jgi:hypothetical protein